MLSLTSDSNLSVFESLSLGEEEETAAPVSAREDPDSRDSGYDGSNGASEPLLTHSTPTDFAAPFPPRPHLTHIRPAPRLGYTAPLTKSGSSHSTSSTLSVHEEEDEGLSFDCGEEEEAGVLSGFRDTKARLASCPIVAHPPPPRPRTESLGTPPSSKSVIRRQRPVQKRKSGLSLLEAGPPTQFVLGSRPSPLGESQSPNIGLSLKRCRVRSPERCMDVEPPMLKRPKSFASEKPAWLVPRAPLARSQSESVLKDTEYGMRPDHSGPLALPLCRRTSTRVREAIEPETLAALLHGSIGRHRTVTLIDCRYPFEFEGGTIKGAEHVWRREAIQSRFFNPLPIADNSIYVFFCEFSQQRGPRMWSSVRNMDRRLNLENYPNCSYPEMYLLEGGYKKFYHQYPDLCEGGYRPMTQASDEHVKQCKDNTGFYSVTAEGGVTVSRRNSRRGLVPGAQQLSPSSF